MNKPIAVLISDVHYNLQTLELADAAMNMAINRANELRVPVIVAGDLHDTKANMRAECVNAMLYTFSRCNIKPYILRGNHDQINEKSPSHALEFLASRATVVERPLYSKINNLGIIPYQYDIKECKEAVKEFGLEFIIVMHQGLYGSDGGHYFQDLTAISAKDVAGRRIISGHYHSRQTIELPEGGKWDYIGNPYTLGFGEANHPPKGYQILMDDGSLEFTPTNLRKHVIIEEKCPYDPMILETKIRTRSNKGDILWVKISGTQEQLAKISKKQFDGVKLDLIPLSQIAESGQKHEELGQQVILDGVIESLTNTSGEQKIRLKLLWKSMV